MVNNVENLFSDIVSKARAIDPENARGWFDKLVPVQMEGGLLRIACPDDNTVQFLKDKLQSTFAKAAQRVTGHLISVEFVNDHHSPAATRKPRLKSPVALHPDYSFSNFVVGPSNRLAHASCVAVSKSPGQTYNPLFLYGSSGLGKTHLLHAVCSQLLETQPDASIQFLSCEQFVNRFISAIEQGDLLGFQNEFRNVDAIIIDDIQFLREREQSQEEFFHTFNSLYNNGKQIILSSDSLPSDIPSLEERLVSRFSWGLVTRIDPPSHDTRVAIVKKKANLRGIKINDEVAEYIARKMQANIRQLEGALTNIYALASTTEKEIDISLARDALEEHSPAVSRQISISDIIDVVTRHYGVRLTDLQSKKRRQSITTPRQICMYLARNLTRHSLEEVGGHLGGRDHTTVMHACEKIEKLVSTDPQIKAVIDELSSQVLSTPSSSS